MCECGTPKIATVCGTVKDNCEFEVPNLGISQNGYVPSGLGFGGGDYLLIKVCLNCGRLQNFAPRTDMEIHQSALCSRTD